MGNKRLWAAMQEKEGLLTRSKLTDEEGAHLASSSAPSPKRTANSAESDRRRASLGPRIAEGEQKKLMKELPRRLQAAGAPGPGALRQTGGAPSRRAPNTSTSTAFGGSRSSLELRGVLLTISHDRHFLNEICTHIRRHRLRDHHHLPGRLRRDGDRQRARSRDASSKRTPSARRRSISQ